MTTLRGIAWAHSRGYVPLVAASQAWQDLHPEIEIVWDKRSFRGFGEGPLDEVARDYDLIVFDHPHTGAAAARRLLLPLDELTASVGPCAGLSRESYEFEGHLYGLPIDAACQTAAYRPDLMDLAGEALPVNWDDVIQLAERTDRVRCAFSPMGSLGMLHSITAGLGAPAGRSGNCYFSQEVGLEAIERLRRLFLACGTDSLHHSPVRILAELADTDRVLYAPLLYCYSNYARPGFAPHLVRFAKPAIHADGAGATLGGAGMGVSAFSQQCAPALAFATWLISEPCQGGPYLLAQGQPALRSIWSGEPANQLTGGFFQDLLPVIDQAYLRPNWPGYGEFQSRAGAIVQGFLRGADTASSSLQLINRLFEVSSCRA
ncbi:MAG: extracellular solute-binding protein [Candidatus Solibacter sp.]